jgi:hypothetical protein
MRAGDSGNEARNKRQAMGIDKDIQKEKVLVLAIEYCTAITLAA